jgi:hypothetical protein
MAEICDRLFDDIVTRQAAASSAADADRSRRWQRPQRPAALAH